MASQISTLFFQFIFISFFAFAAPTLAKLPANQTFRFVNQGEFAGVERDEDLMRWVWDANRNDPVRENATLTFGEDGNFVLADVDGRVVWQTNTANKGVTGIRLLPNGNLVLFDKNENFVWQSFDYPIDTLDFGDIVTFDVRPENENATAYELVLTHEQVNQSTTFAAAGNDGRLLQVRPTRGGNTYNLNKLNYNATISFLRLGSYGNLKAFTYYDEVSYLKWDESFSFFSSYFVRECALPSKCGAYGLCDKRMCVACPNPKGLLGWSESRKPPKSVPCQGGAKEDTSKCLTVPVLGTLIKGVNATSVGYIKYSK
ncbi:hypothetical protein like AT1G78830 [Hibiscus trionum]|uniref:Bulb-type lectin domain-containing protein n=1 Tax=Hibiscus trionum TaxID=183268 RepID=A0A9W7MQ41_HIBTR|nr:hypothetical protein like AT1G78830 [Hibiscus trionum]